MKSLFMTITMAAAFTACGHRASTESTSDADSASTDSTKVEALVEEKSALVLDTISFERNDSMAEVSLSVQWPIEGNEELVKSVRQFVCDVCGIKNKYFKGTKKDFKDIVDTDYNGLVEEWHGAYADSEEGGGPSFTSGTSVVKLAETETFVTFYAEQFGYTGGAHGFATHVGKTFRKSDGKAIGYDMEYNQDSFDAKMKNQTLFADTKSSKLYALIKDGVKRYFKDCQQPIADDNELSDFLQVDDINHIPLPGNAPYLTETGVVFCYTQYEIAPYAAGMITFEVPYAKIRPFLTEEAKALL